MLPRQPADVSESARRISETELGRGWSAEMGWPIRPSKWPVKTSRRLPYRALRREEEWLSEWARYTASSRTRRQNPERTIPKHRAGELRRPIVHRDRAAGS